MPNAEKLAKKKLYFDKLVDLCINTPNALLVQLDHVGSKQMQDIRMELRGKAVVLCGKNTMIRKALSLATKNIQTLAWTSCGLSWWAISASFSLPIVGSMIS